MIPSRINLLGKKFKVLRRDLRNEDCYGRIISKKGVKVIEIDKNLTGEAEEITFYHEVFHFFCKYYNLERSETLIEALSHFTLDIQRQMKGGKYG